MRYAPRPNSTNFLRCCHELAKQSNSPGCLHRGCGLGNGPRVWVSSGSCRYTSTSSLSLRTSRCQRQSSAKLSLVLPIGHNSMTRPVRWRPRNCEGVAPCRRAEPPFPAIVCRTQLSSRRYVAYKRTNLGKAVERATTEHPSRIPTMNQQGRARMNSRYWTLSSAQRTNGVNENEVGSCAG
jgi:hypothetical protein